ncbi:MAG: hypothetical protein ACPIOQ_48925, partial [Promethearchaeia archaeon]
MFAGCAGARRPAGSSGPSSVRGGHIAERGAMSLVGKDVPAEEGLRVVITEEGRHFDINKRGDLSQGGAGVVVEVREIGNGQGKLCMVQWDCGGDDPVPHPAGVLGR